VTDQGFNVSLFPSAKSSPRRALCLVEAVGP
jgi:hypothetical protein